MAGPWEKYAAQSGAQESGPWTKYGEADVTASGVGAEIGKGLLRGAGDVGMMAGKGAAQMVLGPLVGRMAGNVMETLSAPSRELVKAAPANETERFAGTAAEIFGGGVTGGGARSIGGVALNTLASIGGATGEQIGGDVGRVVGTLTPTVAAVAVPAAVKGALRGGEAGRQAMQDRIAGFRAAGIENPSAGQATGNRTLQALESGMSRLPGGAGRMAKAAEEGAEGMGRRVEEIAGELSPGATGTRAGIAIDTGVKDFVSRFKGEQGKLYETLDNYIPQNKPVDMTNTINRMAELNADIAGAPELSKFFKNSTIQALERAMKSDTAEFTTRLPYEAIKKVRTLVGNEISNSNLVSQVPRDKWKALYAALSKDMEAAATEAGPDAVKAFSRANTFSAAGYKRIEDVLNRVAGKDTAEKIFQAATSEAKEGGTTIRGVLRSLKPDEQNVVKSAFIRRLGNATAGTQDDVGGVFSSQTFLTNWNKVSPEAKQALFAGQEGRLRENLDTIAKAANRLKEGSKVFANPSGTAQATANIGGIAALAGSLASGNLGVAATLLVGAAGANLTARLMTNPKFVNWLATTTKASPALAPLQITTLAQTAAKEKDSDLREDMLRYLKTLEQARAAQGNQQ